jgi:hypothetical protein
VAPPDDAPKAHPLLFDPAASDWVKVSGAGFVFEPWGAEFTPPEPGSVLIAFGNDETRQRGVEVSMLDGGWVSIWMPDRSAAFWLPDAAQDTQPWETHVMALDHERGSLR